jgi:glutathione peroxidase-family protein
MKMKIFICTLIISFSVISASAQSIYDYNITTQDTVVHSLSDLASKKIMMVILPVSKSEEDSLYLIRLDSIFSVYSSNLTIIGISSYEDGYTNDTTVNVVKWQQSILDSQILVTQGMFTHQSSDTAQNPLFNWLTHSQLNYHYDEEVGGSGESYFINEQGELYGVFSPEAKWSDKLLTKMFAQ